ARIVADLDVVLDADVEPLRILADQHEVEVAIPAAGSDRMRGADVGIQIERLAQRDVDRAEPFADRRLERALERELGALDGIEGRIRDRIAVQRDTGHSRDLRIPFDVRPGGREDLDRRAADRRSDAVARDQRDLPAHGAMTPASLEATLAVTAGPNAGAASLV